MFARGTSILVAAAIAAACAVAMLNRNLSGGSAGARTISGSSHRPDAGSPAPKGGFAALRRHWRLGRGSRPQHDVAARMEAWRKEFSFDFALMAGDNVYDGGTPEDYRLKFELPYKPFLDADVKFYAALGNHDDPNQPDYKLFNTGGERYYTFAKRMGVIGAARFFVLDTVHLDHQQLRWLDNELGRAKATGRSRCFTIRSTRPAGIARTPRNCGGGSSRSSSATASTSLSRGTNISTSGRRRSTGSCIVTGGAGSLRRGDIGADAGGGRRAVAFDQDYSFLLVEIEGDELLFQAVSRAGETIDAGVLRKDTKTPSPTTADTPGAR